MSIGGVKIATADPINPSWKPSVGALVFGQGDHYLQDPSNGGRCKPPMPTRSPAGYPLFYAIDGNGAAVGNPVVVYADHHFASDAEVETFKANQEQAAKDAAARDLAEANKVYTGPVKASTLGKEDLTFLNWALHQPGKMNWAYGVLNGTSVEIRQAINSASYNNVLGKYDSNSYTGVLKQYFK